MRGDKHEADRPEIGLASAHKESEASLNCYHNNFAFATI
jgi:hypothetical protein